MMKSGKKTSFYNAMTNRLTAQDPPVITHRKGVIPGLFFSAEHAGFAVPEYLDNLGCAIDFSSVHFGCDIGVAAVMKALNALGAETYESTYSRAVLDPNRTVNEPTLIPAIQDGITIPANATITREERQARIDIFHKGYHDPLELLIEARFKENPALLYISVHSMEKRLEIDSLGKKTDGKARPPFALLYRDKEEELARKFAAFFRTHGVEDIGMNVPYCARDEDYKSPIFDKYQPKMPLLLIEFRNDLIRDNANAAAYARLLMDAIEAVSPRV